MHCRFNWAAVWLLAFMLFVPSFLAQPVFALTTCQTIQNQVNYYLNNQPNIYCKYTITPALGKLDVYKYCDTRRVYVKSYTDSLGSVYATYTNPCLINGTNTQYSVTYYNLDRTTEYCDGATKVEADIGPRIGCADSQCWNNTSYCNGSITSLVTADCSKFITNTFYTSIQIPSYCVPSYPGQPIQSPPQPHDQGPACGNSTEQNSTSNLKSGNYHHTQSVISKPARLPFDLYYNSLDSLDTPLGKGWSHTYNLILVEGSTWISLKLGNGDSILFTNDGNGNFLPDPKSGDSSVMSINTDGTYKRTLKDGTIQTFNATAKLSSITDLNGNTLSLRYTGNDFSSLYDSATGRTLYLTSTNGRLATIRDPASRITTFTYTGNLLTSVTGPAGDSWQYAYDTNGRLISKTDPLGYQSTNSYDASGKLISSIDPEGKAKNISYDPTSNTSTITEKDGSIWRQQYDPAINAATVKTDPLGNTTRYSYDQDGNLLTKTAPNGATTSYTYDSNSNLLTETDPLGNITSYSYNNLNLVTSITDPKGATTSYAYDTKGNLTAITDPSGAITTLINNTKGYVTQITDPKGGITKLAYDSINNLTTLTDPLCKITRFTYDAVGNLLSSTDPNNNVISYAYNSLNQRIKMTDAKGNITQLSYDFKGNLIRATDANGNATSYSYNYRGQTTGITDALNQLTQLQYGASGCSSCSNSGNGKLTQLIDALGNGTTYSYDSLGRLQSETDPLNTTTGYQYDSVGNLTTKTDPKGQTISYRYDANNRLIEKNAPEGTTSYGYDQNGNLISATNPNIGYSMTYDALNRLTQVSSTTGQSVSYQYDSLGNRTALTSPAGATINYSYDAASHLTAIATSTGTYSFTYDAGGRRTKLSYPNNTSTSYAYDKNNNLTQIKNTAASGSIIADIPYSYDKVNNRLTRQTTGYSYDTTYQLTATTTGESYSYDANGNRSASSYQHNAANQTLSSPQGSYSYDQNGNQTSRANWTQTWNSDNQLITTTNGTTTVTFTYDPFGRRIEKTTIEPGGSTTYTYLYDGPNIIQETRTTATATETTTYLHGPNIDEPLGMERNGQNYYFHADGLGSIIAITDTNGLKVQSYSYDAFGNPTQTTSFRNSYLFTGREYDPETGLYYYRARYYDPMVGRFVSKDPISFAGGDANLYGYVQNNPVNWTDPWGLASWPANGRVSSPFGPRVHPVTGEVNSFHNGIDITNPVGKSIVASDSGTVVSIKPSPSGANQVIMKNDDGSISGYGHVKPGVVVNQRVSEGACLGTTDLSGRSTGGHVHYTFRPRKGAPHIDPLGHLPER